MEEARSPRVIIDASSLIIIAKERAAELAEVSLYEIVDAVRERRIPSPYRLDDLEEDLRALYKRELPN